MKRTLTIAAITLGLFACGGPNEPAASATSAPASADSSVLSGPPSTAPTETAPAASTTPPTATATTTASATVPPSKKGEACGDDVAIQKKCAAGLKCVMPKGGPVSEHTPGTCQ